MELIMIKLHALLSFETGELTLLLHHYQAVGICTTPLHIGYPYTALCI